MEIGSTNNLANLNSGLITRKQSTEQGETNAFGIGRANQPEVELSAQARILQQNEQTQQARREQANPEQQQEQPGPDTGTDYVRVSSSVGSAARNNLSTEQATEVYRSIQDLL